MLSTTDSFKSIDVDVANLHRPKAAGAGLVDLEKAPGVNAATARLVYDFFHEVDRK